MRNNGGKGPWMAALALAALCAAPAPEDGPRVCMHRGAAAVPFDAAKAERAVDDLAKRLRFERPPVRPVSLAMQDPFDGGLPSCTRREVRRVAVDVPAGIVGKSVLWSAYGGGAADLVVRTAGCSLRDIVSSGAVPGDASLARLWGVRCVPSRVTAVSRSEVEIVEGE